jgi:hypothetical protein
MYNPASPVYSYWQNQCPVVPNWSASSYDYQNQQLVVSLKNVASPVALSTDCLIFQRQSSTNPPWTNAVKAIPTALEAALPAPQYSISAGSYSIP